MRAFHGLSCSSVLSFLADFLIEFYSEQVLRHFKYGSYLDSLNYLMKKQNWNGVLILIWRRILGVGLETTEYLPQRQEGPRVSCPLLTSCFFVSSSSPSHMFCYLISGLCLPDAVVSFQSLSDLASQQHWTLFTTHFAPPISSCCFLWHFPHLGFLLLFFSSLGSPLITSVSQPRAFMSALSIFSP